MKLQENKFSEVPDIVLDGCRFSIYLHPFRELFLSLYATQIALLKKKTQTKKHKKAHDLEFYLFTVVMALTLYCILSFFFLVLFGT